MAKFEASTQMVRASFVLWQLRSEPGWESLSLRETNRRVQEYEEAFDKWLETQSG